VTAKSTTIKVNAVKADGAKPLPTQPTNGGGPAKSEPETSTTADTVAQTPVAAGARATTAAKAVPVKTPAKAAKSAPAKAAASKAEPPPPPRPTRSAAETEKIRVALSGRRATQANDQTMSEIAEAQRDRLTDSAGDDQADTGTKTFEREQEISLANNLRERIGQVERALDRLDDGQYGWCERCGNAIPVERLAAFPSATLCVTCKQLEERLTQAPPGAWRSQPGGGAGEAAGAASRFSPSRLRSSLADQLTKQLVSDWATAPKVVRGVVYLDPPGNSGAFSIAPTSRSSSVDRRRR
jgi:DnaK suppressor protein